MNYLVENDSTSSIKNKLHEATICQTITHINVQNLTLILHFKSKQGGISRNFISHKSLIFYGTAYSNCFKTYRDL